MGVSMRRLLLGVCVILPWLGAVLAFGSLVLAHYPEDGRVSLSLPLDGKTPWFEAFLPGSRASSPERQPGGWTGQRITDEPVYARLRLPGAYEYANIEVEFRPNDQPLVELGVERGHEPQAGYELSPLWSAELAQEGWIRDETSEGAIWRPRTSAASTETAQEGRVLRWYASSTLDTPWMDTGSVDPTTIRASLRGQHDVWMVPVDGALAFTVQMQDMNRSRAASFATFRLTRGDELIWTDSVSFGGKSDTKPTPVVEQVFSWKDLAPGAYKFSILADDSIFVRGWTVRAKRWVIGPRVYFGDEVGYSTSTPAVSVWTNSLHIEAKTLHKEGVQTVSLGASRADIKATHTPVTVTRDPSERQEPVLLRAPQGTLWTVGDGYVSWNKDALFFPQQRRFTDDTRLREEGVQAVMSEYRAPELLADGWYRGRLRVALEPRKDRLKLVLAAPGIATRQAMVDVRKIHVTYERPPRRDGWWESLKADLRLAWDRL